MENWNIGKRAMVATAAATCTGLLAVAGLMTQAGAAAKATTTTCPSAVTFAKQFSAAQVTSQAPSVSTGSSSAFPGKQMTCTYSGSVALTVIYFENLTTTTKKTLQSSFAKEHKKMSGIKNATSYTGTGSHITNVMNASTGKSTTTKVTTSEVVVIPTDTRTPYEIEGNGSISSTLFAVAQALASK